MRSARAVYAEVLGLDNDKLLDDTLVEAASERPLLVLAERGSDAERLARALHDASLRRGGPFVQLTGVPASLPEGNAATARARRGTLVMPIEGTLVDPALLTMLLSADYQVRLVVIAGAGA